MAVSAILIEIGDDMSHFGSAARLASWAALGPGNNESAGKPKSCKTHKGNTLLRALLCKAANAAGCTLSFFKAKYQGLVVRRGQKKSYGGLGR